MDGLGGGEGVEVGEVVGVDEVAARLGSGLDVDCIVDAATSPSGAGAGGDGREMALGCDLDDLKAREDALFDEVLYFIGAGAVGKGRPGEDRVKLDQPMSGNVADLVASLDAY